MNKLSVGIAASTLAIVGILIFAVWTNRTPADNDAKSIDRNAGPEPKAKTPPDSFRDMAREVGLDKFRMNFLPKEQGEIFKINLYDHGCGLAVGDYNGDGHEDIYFLNQLGPNALFRNRGDGTFEDVTNRLGLAFEDRVCVGATFADYDNDGDQDLYITSTRGGNILMRNENHQTFVDVTETSGLHHIGHSQTAAFFDYDGDSWLDLYLVQTAEWTTDQIDDESKYFVGKGDNGLGAVIGAPKEYNRLYRNKGDGTFVDVTEEANLKGRGWSGDVAVFDYDSDGWLDVFVTSMFGRAQLYRNRQDGTFEDRTLESLGKTPFGGIGARAFDYNNDGLLDLYVVDMHSDMWMGADFDHKSLREAVASQRFRFDSIHGPWRKNDASMKEFDESLEDTLDFNASEVVYGNAMYKNLGNGKFEEVSGAVNLETYWPWGVAAGDFDNDSQQDVFLASGMGYPFYYWRNYLLMNTERGVFRERSSTLGIEPPRGGKFSDVEIRGKPTARSSRCAVTADFDGDGRLEIVTNNFNDSPYFYRNHFPKQNYIAFRLRGVQSNRDAIGAVVRIQRGEQKLIRQVHAASGYLSHSSKNIHFGLGDNKVVGDVEITWPSGVRQVLHNPAANQLHEVVESGVVESGVVESGVVESGLPE